MYHLAHGKHLVYFSYDIIIANHNLNTAAITIIITSESYVNGIQLAFLEFVTIFQYCSLV